MPQLAQHTCNTQSGKCNTLQKRLAAFVDLGDGDGAGGHGRGQELGDSGPGA